MSFWRFHLWTVALNHDSAFKRVQLLHVEDKKKGRDLEGLATTIFIHKASE